MKLIKSTIVLGSLAMALVSASSEAAPVQYVTKTLKYSAPVAGQVTVQYPVLTASAGGAFQKINAEIKKAVLNSKCEADPSDDVSNLEFNATFTVQAITKDFVSIGVHYDFSCGGAHPDVGQHAMVFGKKSGRQVDMPIEFGGIPADKEWGPDDLDRYQAYSEKIAKFLAPRAPQDAKVCAEDMGDTVESLLMTMDFGFGLKNGKVVVIADPPHVIEVCGFTVEVKYSEIKALIEPKSVLHTWLK